MPLDLSFLPFFNRVEKAVLNAVEDEVEWFCLPAGQVLYREGERSEAIYLVRSGALAVFREGALEKPDLLGYIRAGEPAGEMSFIEDKPHSASVYALRDSELVRLPKHAFDRLTRKHPSLMRELTETMLRRLRGGSGRTPRAEPHVFALISTSPTLDLDYRASEIVAALTRIGLRALTVGEEASDWPAARFDALEEEYDIVLLAAKLSDPFWARRAMGRADRTWIFARADAHPSVPLLPDDPFPSAYLKLLDVVLVHHGAVRPGASAQTWTDAVGAARLFHWRQGDASDVALLARTLAGRSVGLVLSGGGARAYAHVGAVRALREAGVPFDFTGGASMGAIIAAGVSMGWDDDELERRMRKAFVDTNPLNDWTLPVISLARGRKVDHRLKEHFGEVEIAELVRPFFCVSSNLSTGAARVHRKGQVRHALRASIAIPGLLPPIIDGENVLVDGAVFTNFPATQMSAFHRGANVGADVTRVKGVDPAEFVDPPNFFQWMFTHGLGDPPPIASLLMRAATAGTLSQHEETRNAVDCLILPETDIDLREWKRFDDAVAAGYEGAVKAIKALDDTARARLIP